MDVRLGESIFNRWCDSTRENESRLAVNNNIIFLHKRHYYRHISISLFPLRFDDLVQKCNVKLTAV